MTRTRIDCLRSSDLCRQWPVPPFVAEVAALLYRHDPIGIDFGDNPGEYQPEARTIVARLHRARSVADVRTLVHEQFVHWFGTDTAGDPDRYDGVAQELWAAWRARSSSNES